MTLTHRFGRRLPLPSTAQIRHELIVFSAEEALRQAHVAEALAQADQDHILSQAGQQPKTQAELDHG